MSARRRLTERQVRLFRQRGQLLDRPGRTLVPDAVRRLVGIQAQLPSAAALAIRARSPGTVSAGVDSALHEERSIVRTWAIRGTLHLITAEDQAWLVALTSATQVAGAHRRLAQLGVTGGQPARAVRLVETMVAGEGPLTRRDIADRLARRGIRTEGQAAIHLIRLAALHGAICHGPPRDGEPTFVLVRDWLPGVHPKEPDDPLAELAVRYLTAHAPATPEDLAAWSGVRVTDARRGWERIADRLTEVTLRGTRAWMLRSQGRAPPRGVVRLVPAFDPYLLGWKGRELALPAEHEREVFPGGGMLRAAVVADGLVVGTWGAQRHRARLVVGVRPFARLTPTWRGALDREASDVGRFLGTAAELAVR